MVEIRLTNSKTRRKEAFAPLDPDNVRMYVCGPTVYDRAHLGNARPVVVFDVLYRLLRHVYGEDAVTYVRNFTDVDDKINATALARKEAGAAGTLEQLIRERTEETIGWYHADMDALGTLRPTHEPRATGFIPQMVAMIGGLIDSGHAYEAEGHVLFSVGSYPDYGALSGRTVEDMIAGARVEVAPYKRDPMDFVLWKPSTDDLPGWESPWGRGRPGWHIECSAMADELLGAAFDIHGGGIDLQFPHHENEIAQSCCARPGAGFASVWLHNEMLQVEGKKMSKSLGNFFTVRDLLDQGVPGEVIRFVFLGTHYRKPMDWTRRKAYEAESNLTNMAETLGAAGLEALENIQASEPLEEIVDPLTNDLNTSLALTRLGRRELWKTYGVRTGDADFVNRLYGSQLLLGFDLLSIPRFAEVARNRAARREDGRMAVRSAYAQVVDFPQLASALQELRDEAMISKDFAQVDALKSALVAAGVEVRMSKAGVELVPGPAFDPAKLEGLL